MVIEQFTLLSDEEFYQIHGVEKQVPLLLALSNHEDWGYVAKKINRRNGKTAWKIVNHKDNIIEVPEEKIRLVVNVDSYTFKLWDELSSPVSLARSKGNNLIRKSPSDANIKFCVKGDFKMFKDCRILHQLAECTEAYYNKSHPFNNQWDMDKHSPYTTPKKLLQKLYEKSNSLQSFKKKKTLHAIPFLRNNIKPTKLSVFIKPKEPVPTPPMFFNFPQGIPLQIA